MHRRYTPTRHPVIQQLEREAEPARKKLVEKGLLVTGPELAEHLELPEEWLDESVAIDALFALPVGSKLYFPAFYGHPAFRRSELESVSQAMVNLPGWSKWAFFMRRNEGLRGCSPLEALEQGEFEAVLGAAHAYAQT